MQFTVKEASKRARIAAFYLGYPNVAIVFGSTIYLWNIKREHFLNDKKHLAHELCHVAQFRKYGFLRFLILYCWESLIHGYYNNKFEIEARAAESTTEQ
ncbi:MAG TPA: DUF4157 domain-containing protein [Bacteroidia bacterium]|nr:DUF4157 domain-containing protein [Bacteroidia bacterium]HRH08335.1 DUF4157 domain-containing protein [Bacteroidia bacterium]